MERQSIEDLLQAEPFRPFRISTNNGKEYVVENPSLVHALKTYLFYAFPNSDHFALIDLRSISTLQTVDQAA